MAVRRGGTWRVQEQAGRRECTPAGGAQLLRGGTATEVAKDGVGKTSRTKGAGPNNYSLKMDFSEIVVYNFSLKPCL